MEWSLAIAGMLGALAGVIKASNCKKVSICKIIECEKAQTEGRMVLRHDS